MHVRLRVRALCVFVAKIILLSMKVEPRVNGSEAKWELH